MLRLQKFHIQSQVEDLTARKKRLQWLVQHNIKAYKVANFGCHIGGETLALAWVLNAYEGIGIDRDKLAIQQARSTLLNIQEDITRVSRMLGNSTIGISDDDKIWWNNEVPDFFRKTIVESGFRVDYAVEDITERTILESNYYDIAYCDFVLHHIWYDETRQDQLSDTRNAVGEMARVVRQGGVVAAVELLQYDDKPKLDFRALFEHARLSVIHEKVIHKEGYILAEYLCEKV